MKKNFRAGKASQTYICDTLSLAEDEVEAVKAENLQTSQIRVNFPP